ncbi:Na/Pi cotransporter family protein [Sphingomonas xinjiangensis]|uniref:Phosphate:Na+ symporter n=1 Tax=Sphingomonas xinjiangensis TaxID=643568 RepID=A0A840YS70_9SPHN|nr:Na/Pi symporter [Sphingomonas xinjiangensis]MBB5712526.1 phosphate:Na+ symporter [Sphingomonas xinjiangensis]
MPITQRAPLSGTAVIRVIMVVGGSLMVSGASAQTGQASEPFDWVTLAMGAIGGLALFLYGVDILATALKQTQGGRFQKLLQRSSSNRFVALASGTAATVVLDSSSVVIILLMAIVDAGLISFAHSLPFILGANIGTTFSSQVFAWNIDTYAPLIIAAGLLWKGLGKSDKAKQRATILLGLGMVLFGLNIIGIAAEPLQDRPEIIGVLRQLENPLLGVFAGALVTIAIQSSSAMMGIVITLAGGGLITLPAGVAMMLGAEIGTCADTLVATVGRSRAAVKAGIFHLAFNIISVAIGVLLVDQLASFGKATAGDTGQSIANAHVLFNIAGALLVLPFVTVASKLIERMVPAKRGAEPLAMANPVSAQRA